MGKIKGLDHISIYTRDMEMSLNYYRDMFGFEVIDREMAPFGDFALIRLGDCTIEVIVPPDPSTVDWDAPNGEPVISHFGLKVEGLDEVYEELKAKGMKFNCDSVIELPVPLGGLRAVTTTGPNGETINLYEFADPK